MIISKTPFRISFFGGGTDYPVWYKENGGSVLGTSINKYCYITCRYLPPFFEHKYRIIYSAMEHVVNVDEIRHPAVRETIKYLGIDDGLEIHHDGDLPARTGLGSSSSFTVGLLNALYALAGINIDKMQLAREATFIEQERIKEHVGSQDQVLVAFGGLQRVDFKSNNDVQVHPITLTSEMLASLQDHMMLFFTGFSRTASLIAAEQINQTPNKKMELREMQQMVDEAIKILSGNHLTEFGKLLHESWHLKRSLTDKISNPFIDFIYNTAISNGATGGKLLGAGGGGFLLLFVQPELQEKIKNALQGLLYVPIKFEKAGSQIIYKNND
jgi:D-glycero-alpha-D-manno-heptose-7-phosphate kinase